MNKTTQLLDLADRVMQTVGKHFITLSCVQYPPSDGLAKPLVFSGFVVDVSGEWFYVTAGHIVRDIRRATQSGSSFDRWRLDDQTAGNHFDGKAVPYGFDEEDWLVLEDARTGLDYAAVHLGGLYRRQLEVGGVIPISQDVWSDHVTESDHWILLGIPSETVEYDGETEIEGRVVISPLVSADEPALAGGKSINQFYAKPADGSEKFFVDADGMSGGPVFALRKVGEQWLYGAIGVQSGWYPTSRTLAICPFSTFGMALEEVVAKTRAVEAQTRHVSGSA